MFQNNNECEYIAFNIPVCDNAQVNEILYGRATENENMI